MSEVTWEQFDELRAQMKSGRVTRELFQDFLGNPQSVKSQPSEYVVTVDYGKTLKEMIAAGQYDWENSDINSDNFQIEGDGTVETKLELVHLNKDASTKEVEAYFEKNGLRAATLEELLAFGAKFPEVQREFPVIALGSAWVSPDGRRGVLYLDRGGSKRNIFLYWRERDWYGLCRFLAFRK